MADRDDLVRVDLTGTVHPVGKSASQELRARAGEWRLSRSPIDALLLRRVNKTENVLRLAGEIKTPGALCDVIGKRFGEAAVELAIASPERLYPMMARQVEEVFYAALHVADGTFYFYDRFDDAAIGRRHALNAAMLLMEGARRMDEMRFFRERIPNEHYTAVPRDVAKKPPDDLVRVLAECDGKRSIAQIGRRLGLLEFEVTRAVFQLASGGFLTVVAPRPQGAQTIMDGFNPALIEIHSRCDAAGKGPELRDGLARFATGGGVYDPLFQSAGPLPDGSFRSDRVERNLAALAGDDPDAWLIQLMHDYIGFALFQAGSLLPRDVEAKLAASVSESLKPLRPADSAPLSRRP